jgi:hypothetical protein
LSVQLKGDAHEVGGSNQVNVVFAVPTSANAQRPVGHVNVAAAVGSDKYDLLKSVLANLDAELGTLLKDGVTVNGKPFTLEVLLTSDWKFHGTREHC